MAEIRDGGGGGSTDICLVSPSDQAGQINNILDRVHNLELAVAQLAGLDVNATNLSDMVESLGTITNGTIMMPDNSISGWTNSIPPGNFTGSIMSNGVITTWTDGVVSFEVLSTGGGGVTVGGGGGVTDAILLKIDNQSHQTWVATNGHDFDSQVAKIGSDIEWDTTDLNKINFLSSGWYRISISCTLNISLTTSGDSTYLVFGGNIQKSGGTQQVLTCGQSINKTQAGSYTVGYAASQLFYADDANWTFLMGTSTNYAGGSILNGRVSAEKLA